MTSAEHDVDSAFISCLEKRGAQNGISLIYFTPALLLHLPRSDMINKPVCLEDSNLFRWPAICGLAIF